MKPLNAKGAAIRAHRDLSRSNQPLAPVYRVGELLREGQERWPEGAQFSFGPGVCELILVHNDIDEDLVEAVRRGPAEFALIVESQVLLLAYRFGDAIAWNDVPYS